MQIPWGQKLFGFYTTYSIPRCSINICLLSDWLSHNIDLWVILRKANIIFLNTLHLISWKQYVEEKSYETEKCTVSLVVIALL
jgi:hypothetical protein